jgi:ABC-type phosphate transport system auxiliary subunit
MRVYVCVSGRHVHRPVADVDEAVETMILTRLEESDATGAVVDSTAADLVTSLTGRLTELRRQHETKADDLLEADASDKTVATVLGALERKIAKVETDLNSARASLKRPEAALEGMTGSDAAQAWAKASLGRRQAVLRFLCVSITVRGSKRNGRG